MSSVEEMRAKAADHARQIEAVRWLSVGDLSVRWGVSPGLVRKIARDALPYLTLGGSSVRRYDPRDVEAYEETAKRGTRGTAA